MEAYLLDWANLLLRWLHVVTAIAWVGSSFYFVFLDSSLTPPQDADLKRQGATGELWAVHGGGFYHPVKYAVAPPQLPPHLHWFYWESYSTWMSGFALLCVTYLWNAQVYLIDPARVAFTPAGAVGAALAFLLGFWLLYDGICRLCNRLPAGMRGSGWLEAVGIGALVVLAAWLACQWFAGRAAFVLVGAAMATAMSANVLVWIIPGQRKVVAAIRAGQPPNPVHGLRGKQRSVHNTYFTLPVLVAMLSNHYSFAWSHPHHWLVLVLLMLVGALVRQFFVLRHGHRLGRNRHPWPWALAGVLLLLGLVIGLRPARVDTAHNATKLVANSAYDTKAERQKDHKNVFLIVEQRCTTCHGAQVQMKNLRLDTPAKVRQHAHAIYQQVVVQRLMPMNNATQITEAERAAIARWYESGAALPPAPQDAP
jgi:uncharacterized membrane protein